MSRKWQRSKAWDDEHLTGALRPVKWILRAFSSIPLAVVLLSFVVVYAILASVPIGLLVLGVTYLFYGLTLVGLGLVFGVPSAALVWLATRKLNWGIRFSLSSLVFVVLTGLGVVVWVSAVWPQLRFDPATGDGVRFFGSFVEAYESTTMRRLPGVELTELEFYGAWPLQVVLLAFVANMVTATVRRIEFIFPNIGVLTVHTGIVIMALGSVYYSGLKQEGMAVLRAGIPATPTSEPGIGPPTTTFYDNIEVSLFLDQGEGWEQRTIRGVPRYNDYNLDVVGGTLLSDQVGQPIEQPESYGPLDVRAPVSNGERVDPALSFRVVGYASYAQPRDDWARQEAPESGAMPVRLVHIHAPNIHNATDDRPAFSFGLHPTMPSRRATNNGALDVEYLLNTSDERWAEITAPLPLGSSAGVVVEVPGAGHREVVALEPGRPVAIGDTGYELTLEQVLPQPPFAIITPDYEDASCAVALIDITKPDGTRAQRWAYHRFPEISQDFSDPDVPGGRPQRGPADPAIRLAFIDDSHSQLYIDERPDGTARIAIRTPIHGVRVFEGVEPGGRLEDIFQHKEGEPKIDLALGERWDHAELVTVPVVTPEEARNPQLIGTHDMAMVAVEVSDDTGWTETVWLQATGYPLANFGPQHEVVVHPPSSRPVRMVFGSKQRPLPGFAVQLVDFNMIAYDHRGAPRDYQSTVRVVPTGQGPSFEPYTHLAKLNAPLQAPFMWSDDRSLVANVFGTLASRLNPHQFKLSQAQWDAGGWEQTQAMADAGEIARPFARWTILGVGNNPGIHIIALGGILISVGTPWAFYVKPAIMRARKRKIQKELAASAPPKVPAREPVGAES